VDKEELVDDVERAVGARNSKKKGEMMMMNHRHAEVGSRAVLESMTCRVETVSMARSVV
jgi:hypothetical protein